MMTDSISVFLTIATAVALFVLTIYFILLARVADSKVVLAFWGFVGGFMSSYVGLFVAVLVADLATVLVVILFALLASALALSLVCVFGGVFLGYGRLWDSYYLWIVPVWIGSGIAVAIHVLSRYAFYQEAGEILAVWIEDSIQRIGELDTWLRIIGAFVGILGVIGVIMGAGYKVAKDMAQKEKGA